MAKMSEPKLKTLFRAILSPITPSEVKKVVAVRYFWAPQGPTGFPPAYSPEKWQRVIPKLSNHDQFEL